MEQLDNLPKGHVMSEENDEVLKGLFAPSRPINLPYWFEVNQKSVANTSLITTAYKVRPNSWINVETAALFVSTRFPSICEECTNQLISCELCGKEKSNFSYCMTANMDSDWLVFELMQSVESEFMNLVDGFFCLFDRDAYRTIDLNAGLSFSSQEMVPIRIATLDVSAYVPGYGMLFIGDGSAAINGADFVSGIVVSPGTYEIVAWLGFTSSGDLAPMALSGYGPAFQDSFIEDSKLKEKIEVTLEQIIRGSDDASVLARIGNNQDHYAEVNSSFYNDSTHDSWTCKNSWQMQNSFIADPEAWTTWFESLQADFLSKLMILDGLRIRGLQDAFNRLVLTLIGSSIPREQAHEEIVKVLQDLPVGFRYLGEGR